MEFAVRSILRQLHKHGYDPALPDQEARHRQIPEIFEIESYRRIIVTS